MSNHQKIITFVLKHTRYTKQFIFIFYFYKVTTKTMEEEKMRCKYHKECEYYREESYTCNAPFYAGKGYCGKYRKFEGEKECH